MNWELLFKILMKGIADVYHSRFFFAVKIFLGIYSAILFIDLILLVLQRGLRKNIRQSIIGFDMPPELTSKKEKMRKRWGAVRKRLETGREAEYKIAIIEADAIIDDLIKRMGYGGENFGERLAGIPDGQLENVGDMKEAHEMRNRIVQEDGLQITKDEAEKILEKFESLLRYFEVLD